ncbi:MAG: ABC transporter ATP-binding protein [Syntrophobacterales bacterium]|nr:MAG: ABC transporter ATP-binding protein [Syntrophobacterales bacterium]
MKLLEIHNVTKFFGGLAALTKVNISISFQEILGLIGPNGAGKTTLFNCITGIYPPSEGRILFSGEDITGLGPHEIAKRGAARTFQLTKIFSEVSLLENIMMARYCRTKAGVGDAIFNTSFAKREKNESREKSLYFLELVGLITLRDELPKNLPYGSQRRLAIAIALATEPTLLLLDEPAAGMNPEESDEMIELIGKIRGLGITIFLVEHDMRVIMGISDRIVVLNFGEIIGEGSPQEIQENERVIEAYLGKEEYA